LKKNLSLFGCIAKEISRQGAHTPRALNFARIARSNKSALKAIVRDLNFFHRNSFSFQNDARARNFFCDRKYLFRSDRNVQESQ